MKKLFLALLTVFAIPFTVLAGPADLFDIDEASLDQEFASLNELEANLLYQNPGLTLSELTESDQLLLNRLELNAAELNANPFQPSFDLLTDIEWAAFAWGFCCGTVGVEIELHSDRGYEYNNSGLIGCAVKT